MNQFTGLLSRLGIRPGERRLVGLMLLYALFIGAPGLLTETAAYSLFLVEYDAAAIPYVYIGFAILTTFSGFIYTYLEPRISFTRFISLNMMLLILVLCLFRFLLELPTGRWSVAALAIWYESSWVLANLGFWSLAVHLFNVRQGKRLFALIGTGLILSESIIGFFIPSLVSLVGTANLLLVAASSFFVAMIIQSYILQAFTSKKSSAGPVEKLTASNQQSDKSSWLHLFRNHYITLIFAFATLYIFGFFIVDNLFYERLEVLYPDADQLASFIGIFFGATGLLTVLLGALFSGQLINRYGLRFGLLILPLVLLLGTGITLFIGIFFEAVIILVWLVIGMKLINELLAHTINRAAWQVLYEPLPQNQQVRTQTVVESIIKPTAGGVVGGILLLSNTIFGFGITQLSYILSITLLIWIGVIFLLNRDYPKMLLQALANNKPENESGPALNEIDLTLLKHSLTSPQPSVVLYALDKLEETAPDMLIAHLPTLLKHPVIEIRLEGLRRIERLEILAAIPAINHHLEQETSSVVKAAAIRCLIIISGAEAFGQVQAYLTNQDPQVRLGVMIGLLNRGMSEDIYLPALRETLRQLAHAADPIQREFLAQALGEVGTFTRPNGLLLKLLRDDNLNVRRAALLSASKLKEPELWPAVIEQLASVGVQAEAEATLVAGNETVLPFLMAEWKKPKPNREILLRLPQTIARIGKAQALNFLKERLTYPDEQVRSQIFEALSHCGFQANSSEAILIREQIKVEIDQASWTLATLVDIGNDEVVSVLVDALNEKLSQHRNRLFLLLSFIYDTQSILRARAAYSTQAMLAKLEAGSDQAYALELIDVLVAPEIKSWLLPLLQEDLTPEERLQMLTPEFPQPCLKRRQRLKLIISGPKAWLSSWLKACALYTVGRMAARDLAKVVRSSLSDPELLIKETALWSLSKIEPGLGEPYINELIYDPTLHNANTLSQLGTKQKQSMNMISLIERIIHLKSTDLFAEVSSETLAVVANNLRVLFARSGQTFIEEGQPNRSLYIIVEGQVRVHSGQQEIATFSQYDSFGELSLLDPGFSPISITAVEDTRVLCLDQDQFYHLVDNHRTVTHKVLQRLVQRVSRAESRLKSKATLNEVLTKNVNPLRQPLEKSLQKFPPGD